MIGDIPTEAPADGEMPSTEDFIAAIQEQDKIIQEQDKIIQEYRRRYGELDAQPAAESNAVPPTESPPADSMPTESMPPESMPPPPTETTPPPAYDSDIASKQEQFYTLLQTFADDTSSSLKENYGMDDIAESISSTVQQAIELMKGIDAAKGSRRGDYANAMKQTSGDMGSIIGLLTQLTSAGEEPTENEGGEEEGETGGEVEIEVKPPSAKSPAVIKGGRPTASGGMKGGLSNEELTQFMQMIGLDYKDPAERERISKELESNFKKYGGQNVK